MDRNAGLQQLTVTLAVADPHAVGMLRTHLSRMGATLRDLGADTPAGLVLYESGPCGTPEAVAEEMGPVISLMESPEVTEVFLLAPNPDPALLIEAMRLGVKEFLSLPVSEEELLAAMGRYRERRIRNMTVPSGTSPASEGRQGGLIVVAGSKGGIGTTSIAVNLAAELQASGHRTALLEMTPTYGDVAMFLDIEARYHWGEAFRNLDRLDFAFLSSLMTRHTSGLHVLTAPSQYEEAGDVSPDAMDVFLRQMREGYDFTVVDLGGYLEDLAFMVMKSATRLLLVADLSLPSLASLKQLTEGLERLGTVGSDKIGLVFNRVVKKVAVTVDEAEDIIGRKAFWQIPDDYQAVLSSINQGLVLRDTAPKSQVTKAVTKLAAAVAGERRAEKKTSKGPKSAGRGSFSFLRRGGANPKAGGEA